MFDGTFELQRYSEVENRILQFEHVESIGKDESGQYEMYKIILGDITKPPILITAGVHGVETQGTQYSLHFFEQLRDDTFDDKAFRDHLLSNFCIVYLPCLNPWGMDNIPDHYAKFDREHYRNVNYVDINRDFVSKSQQETRNVISVMNEYDYFAHLDIHLMYPNYHLVNHEKYVVANENYNLQALQNVYADRWEEHTGTDVMRWDVQPERFQMVRGYSIEKPNPYTPHTLPFMTEIMRPTHEEVLLTDEEIYKYGFYSLYEFFNVAMDYFYEHSGVSVDYVKLPFGEATVTRDLNGVTQMIEEKKGNRIIQTTFDRDDDGVIRKIIRNTKG